VAAAIPKRSRLRRPAAEAGDRATDKLAQVVVRGTLTCRRTFTERLVDVAQRLFLD
jgi:hypothetical protein